MFTCLRILKSWPVLWIIEQNRFIHSINSGIFVGWLSELHRLCVCPTPRIPSSNTKLWNKVDKSFQSVFFDHRIRLDKTLSWRFQSFWKSIECTAHQLLIDFDFTDKFGYPNDIRRLCSHQAVTSRNFEIQDLFGVFFGESTKNHSFKARRNWKIWPKTWPANYRYRCKRREYASESPCKQLVRFRLRGSTKNLSSSL